MALKLEIAIPILGTADFTPALRQGSLVVRLNTLDFAVVDPANTINAGAIPAIGDGVQITALSWLGNLTAVTSSDLADVRGAGRVIYECTATASKVPFPPPAGGASQLLTDQPPAAVTDDLLLEDGSGTLLLEDGTLTEPGSLELESGGTAYQRLSVRVQTNAVATGFGGVSGFGIGGIIPGGFPPGGTTSTLGRLTTFQGGLWPGIQFSLTSSNQSIAAVLYTVTEVRITWPGLSTNPVYEVTFGSSQTDIPWTLRGWTQALIHG